MANYGNFVHLYLVSSSILEKFISLYIYILIFAGKILIKCCDSVKISSIRNHFDWYLNRLYNILDNSVAQTCKLQMHKLKIVRLVDLCIIWRDALHSTRIMQGMENTFSF